MSNCFLAKYAPFDFSGIFSNIFTRWYYYAILAVCLVAIILFLFLKKQPKRNALSGTQKLVYTAVFAALCTLVNIFTIKLSDVFQISLVATVGFLAGYLLGGGLGFAACFAGDLLGSIINPLGTYNPIINIGTGLWGFIPGIIFSFFKGNEYIKTIVSFLICAVVISGGVNTVGLFLMYGLGKSTFVYYLTLLPLKLAVVAVNAAICIALISVLPRILPKNKFFIGNKKKKEKNDENSSECSESGKNLNEEPEIL